MSDSSDPAGTAADIAAHFRGAIASGLLADGERLPSVRQVAADMSVALGTAARAFRILEADGLIVSRIGSGTRVAPGVAVLPLEVMRRLRALVESAQLAQVDQEQLHAVLTTVWRQNSLADPAGSGESA